MKPIPETVQIGPWTYRISFTEAGSPREEEFGRCSFDRNELVIYISSALSPQRQATWLLAIVLEIILQNMGVDNHGEVSREVAYHLASAWGASPNVVAFIEAGLLSGRPEWEGKIDDDGHEEDWTDEAEETPKEMEPRSIIIGKQNDPNRPFYDQPPEPVDVECDTNHSPMAATTPAHKFKSVGYRTLELRPENGSLTGHISQADYSAIVNSGWDTFDNAYEAGRFVYRDGWFELPKPHHVPDAVRDYLDRLGVSVGQALREGAVEVVDGVVQLTMRDDESPDVEPDDGPLWHFRTHGEVQYIHFADDWAGMYWSMANGEQVYFHGENSAPVATGHWAEYHPPLPRMTGEPRRDATGRLFQTVFDDDAPLTRTRVVPYGYHPPQAKG